MSFITRSTAAAVSLITSLAAAPGWTGDFATFMPLGFSPDGGIFAFEEFGIQDGSGFPYSNIYFIDTDDDTFLDGTPIRVRLDDENETLSTARGVAVGEALELIQQHDLLDHPGWLAAFNPVTEEGGDAGRLTYRAHPNLSETYRLELDDFALDATSACASVTPEARGFRLSYDGPDGTGRVLHEDNRIPVSRGCPTGYRLGGVMTYRAENGDNVQVALISVLTYGFEGNDGRWIAIPFRP